MADCSRVECDPALASPCDDVHAAGEFASVVVPSRGDNYLREQYMICALKTLVDAVNTLEARVVALETP